MPSKSIKYLIILACLYTALPVWGQSSVKLGNTALEKENFNQAAEHYQNALKERKTFKAYLGLGDTQSRLGNWDRAINAYRSAIKISDQKPSIELLVNLGQAEYMGQKYEDALETFQNIYASRPDHDTHIWLARCLINTRQWTRAQNILLKALASKPQDTQGLELLAYMFAQTGRAGEAISIHKKLVKNNTGQTKYLLALAKAQTAAEDYDNAIDTLEFAARIKHDTSNEATRLLADLYINRKMYRQAAFCYQRIIANSEKPSAEDHFRLGYTYFQTGEYHSANQAFKKTIQIDPSNQKAAQFLGHVAAKKCNTQAARQYYLQAAKTGKPSKEPFLYLAELEFNNKNHNAAATHFAKAISLGEKSVNIHYNHVLALMLSGQNSSARTAVTEALKKHPTNEKLQNLLSRLINKTIEVTK